ncbi:MAG: helix-turn-helix transcriptional regulator [Chloroflexi bacterium]|nr:helix-turn-helix transcriptional regulator [Chloroflexota bacterium]
MRTRSKVTEAADACPVARAARLLGDTWSLLVFRDLAQGPKRFSELLASTGMSPRVLSRRLRGMEEQSLLTRRAFAEAPPRVEYTLTEKGDAALPLVDALRAYGERWLPLPSPAGHRRGKLASKRS